MVTLANNFPTLMDLTKQIDPDGSIATVAEVLNQVNEGLDEIGWVESNLTEGHRHTIRTGLPDVTWQRLYRGVQPSHGRTAQITDHTGAMESLSEVDKRLVDMAPDPMQFRFNEDRPHIEALSQEFFHTLFYGGSHEADKFIGLSERFSDTTASNAENIFDGQGAQGDGDLTSLWLIAWSDRSIFGLYPKGRPGGLVQKDYGEDWALDAAGGKYRVLNTYFEWGCGLAVKDWRYAARYANISLADLTPDASTGPNLPVFAREMMARLPTDAWGMRVAFYCNRRLIDKWAQQTAAAVTNSTLRLTEVGAVGEMMSPRKKWMFDGSIPVNRVDAISTTETEVVFS